MSRTHSQTEQFSSTERFSNRIVNEDELRAIIRPPRPIVAEKSIDHIDEHCRSFIERSPFVLIASSDGEGRFDVSPKGDPPGFVKILDEKTLAIPERPGNHRADTFTNVLKHPHVGLIFLVPGVQTTMRVAGRATIVADQDLLDSMTVALPGKEVGRPPKLALIVEVEDAMLHCAKCVIRSQLWNSPDLTTNPTAVSGLAKAMVDQNASAGVTLEQMQEMIDHDVANNLY
ncbi:MAG: PPOX class probable FMN-dependent enzyme [Acidimicrobiales bacterium]|jgi:PPOX class probable FMN-dependent enzyme